MASGGNLFDSDFAYYRFCRRCHKPFLWPTYAREMNEHERRGHPYKPGQYQRAARIFSRNRTWSEVEERYE